MGSLQSCCCNHLYNQKFFATNKVMDNKIRRKSEALRAGTLAAVMAFSAGHVEAKPPQEPQKQAKQPASKGIKSAAAKVPVAAAAAAPVKAEVPETEAQIADYLKRKCKGVLPEREAYVAIDAKSGEILTHKDKDEIVQISSMTKLMTGLLAFEAIQAGKIREDTPVKIDTSWNSLSNGNFITNVLTRWRDPVPFIDIITAAMVGSKNDATVAIAVALAGSEANFVRLMNERTKQLGLKITFFNSHGLPRKEVDAIGDEVSDSEKGGAILSVARLHKFITETQPRLVQIMGSKKVELQGKTLLHTLKKLFEKVGFTFKDTFNAEAEMNAKSGTTCLSGSSTTIQAGDIIFSYVGAKTSRQREARVVDLLRQAQAARIENLSKVIKIQPLVIQPLKIDSIESLDLNLPELELPKEEPQSDEPKKEQEQVSSVPVLSY